MAERSTSSDAESVLGLLSRSAATGTRKAAGSIWKKLSLKSKAIIISSAILFLALITVISGGSQAQLDSSFQLTAAGDEDLEFTKEDEEKSFDRDLAKEDTAKLMEVVRLHKESDYRKKITELSAICSQNGWDFQRSFDSLSVETAIAYIDSGEDLLSISGSDSYLLSAYSVSLANGQIIHGKGFKSFFLSVIGGERYTDQAGNELYISWFGKAGDINYEENLGEKLNGFEQKGGSYYSLDFARNSSGSIAVYDDPERIHHPAEKDEEGNIVKEAYTEIIHHYYVHPIITELDLSSMAFDIFGVDPDGYFVNAATEYGLDEYGNEVALSGTVTNREAINSMAQLTNAVLFDVDFSSNSILLSAFSGQFEWPCPASNVITSVYGPRVSPTPGASTFHKAIDISCPVGSEIVSIEDGKVIQAGLLGAGGLAVTILHAEGFKSRYEHLSQLGVSVGDTVKRGQVIALSGNTGVSTGPHLDFRIYDPAAADWINPLPYVVNSSLSVVFK